MVESQAAVVNALVQRSARGSAGDFRVKAATFRRELARFRQQLEGVVTETAMKKAGAVLTKIDTGFTSMERNALKTIEAIAAGDEKTAMTPNSRRCSRVM